MAIEGYEGVFGYTAEIYSAEHGQDARRVKRNAEVGLSSGKEARNAAPKRDVRKATGRLVVGFDIRRYATSVSDLITRSARESIGTDTAAGIGGNNACPTISTWTGVLAVREISCCDCIEAGGTLTWEDNQCHRNNDSGGDKKDKDNQEKGEAPDRHAAALAALPFLVEIHCVPSYGRSLTHSKIRVGKRRGPTRCRTVAGRRRRQKTRRRKRREYVRYRS